MTELDTLRYPVGKFERLKAPLTRTECEAHLKTIRDTPARFRSLVNGLTESQLDTPYRPGGWTIRQVVHHVPDSHLNVYIRTKLAMTEDAPIVKTYDEQLWAELPDAKTGAVGMSLALLDAIHLRWVAFLENLSDTDFAKTYVHPELGSVTLGEALAMYAWHCRHHAAHIEQALGHPGRTT